jgi:predicted transcriptional regulator
MVKTTIYLDEDLAQSLRVISKRRSRPQAELIREALRKFTVAEKPPLPEGMGMFDSGHTATAATRKQLFRAAARSGRWR